MFPAEALTRFSLSFQGHISYVYSQVLPACSALPSFCCFRLAGSWTQYFGPSPCLGLQTHFPRLQPAAFLSVLLALEAYPVVLTGQGQRPSLREPKTCWRRAGNQNRKHRERPGSHNRFHLDRYRCVVMEPNVNVIKPDDVNVIVIAWHSPGCIGARVFWPLRGRENTIYRWCTKW